MSGTSGTSRKRVASRNSQSANHGLEPLGGSGPSSCPYSRKCLERLSKKIRIGFDLELLKLDNGQKKPYFATLGHHKCTIKGPPMIYWTVSGTADSRTFADVLLRIIDNIQQGVRGLMFSFPARSGREKHRK
jgi:hypothetical protein